MLIIFKGTACSQLVMAHVLIFEHISKSIDWLKEGIFHFPLSVFDFRQRLRKHNRDILDP